jgi:phosphate transport system ATP-binding protein
VRTGCITAVVGPSEEHVPVVSQSADRSGAGLPRHRAIALDGQDVHGPHMDVIAPRRRVGMIFQKPNPFPL